MTLESTDLRACGSRQPDSQMCILELQLFYTLSRCSQGEPAVLLREYHWPRLSQTQLILAVAVRVVLSPSTVHQSASWKKDVPQEWLHPESSEAALPCIDDSCVTTPLISPCMRTRTLVKPWTLGHLMGSDEILGRAPTQSPQIPRG